MKRRNFLQNTATLLASGGLTLPVLAQKDIPVKKAFKVRALETRYKEKISYSGIPLDFKLLSDDTQDRLSVFISSNNRKGFGPPLHLHHSFDEFFCVMEGQFAYQLDEEMMILNAGDTLFIPRNVKHSFNCMSEKPGTLLVGMTPAKGLEQFFAQMGKLLSVQGMPDMAALEALYKSYDSEILGPPIK